MKQAILLSRSFCSNSLYLYGVQLKLRDYYFLGIILTRESACPEVDSRQVGGLGFGDVLAIPFILLNIVDRTVAAVCEFVNLAVAFADHTAKLKALTETADTAEKVQKGHGFVHRLSSFRV